MASDSKPLGWTLELFDHLSAPGKSMASSIDEVTKKLEAQVVASRKAQGQLDALGEAEKRQAQIHRMVTNQLRQRADAAFKADVSKNLDKALGKESPLVKINSDLSGLGKIGLAGAGLDAGALMASVAAGGALAGVFSFGVLPAVTAVVGTVGKIAGAVFDAGKAVGGLFADIARGAVHKERSQFAMDLLMGAEDARHIRDYIDETAKHSAFLEDPLKDAAKQLVVAGFSVAQIPHAMAAAQDMAALTGGGLEEAAQALEKVKLTGKLEGRVLKGMMINEADAMGNLGKILGVTPKAAEKAMNDGKAGVDNVLAALYQTISQKTHGPLGTAAVAAGNTVGALLAKIKSLPERYLDEMSERVAHGDQFASFRETLQKLNALLDPTSEAGGRFIEKMGRLLDWLTDFLLGDALKNGPGAVSGLEAALSSIGDVMDSVIPTIKIMVQMVKDLVGALAANIPGGTVVGDLLSMLAPMGKLKADADRAKAAGDELSRGMADGILAGIPEVNAAMDALAAEPEKVTRDVLKISSPSRVFRDLGRNVSDGFAEGVASGSRVSESVADMSRPPSSMGGARTATVSMGDIVINVTGGATNDETADAIASRLRSEFPSLLCQMWEVLGTEAGS